MSVLFYLISILIAICGILAIVLYMENCDNINNLNTTERFESSKDIPITFIIMTSIKERVDNVNNIIKNNDLRNTTIYDAVIGKEQNRELLYKNNTINEFTKNKIRDGAIGCTLSHINIWKEFVNSKTGSDKLVVMEDDVDVVDDFKNKLQNYATHLPSDFDISQIYLSDTNERNNSNVRKINDFVETGYPQNGTVGYIISKNGANKLLKHSLPMYEAVDIMIKDAIRKKKIISFVPTEKLVLHKYKFESSVCGKGKACNSTM
jgi:GR25 family glycosyltransferase involved in LPS biosynthesis